MLEFKAWPKTPRFFRDIVITEKIDGTNAAVIVQKVGPVGSETYHPALHGSLIGEDTHFVAVELEDEFYIVGAQSRKRVITPDSDNFGFARWVWDNAEALAYSLGEGYHFGEWWGSGIQRGYGLTKGEKRFSLFNVHRYEKVDGLYDVVPVLYRGPLSTYSVNRALDDLETFGSHAAPDFMKPEGVVVFHSASGQVYKALIENDDIPKGLAA